MNKVNFISDTPEQESKTKENWYQERINEIKDVIYQDINIDGDESIINWLDTYQTQLPLGKINSLKNGEALAIELKREPAREERGGRNNAPSMPKDKKESLFVKAKYKLAKKDKKTPLQPGEKTIQLIISRATDPRFPENKKFKVKAVEFQIPGENILLADGVVFEKELTGKEFEDIIDTLDVKNPKDREE